MSEAFETIKILLFGSIISPLVWLLMAFALFYFLWGVVRFIAKAEDSQGRTEGAQHMIWGIIGLAIMISAFGIVAFIFSSVTSIGGNTGVDGSPIPTPGILNPNNPGF